MDLKEKIKDLPDCPGVYMFKDSRGHIIYVGKASSLKTRVRSYYGPAETHKTRLIAAGAADLDFIPTESEIEALIIEGNLIKEHQPRYNVLYRDDKRYPLLKVTMQEDYPRLLVARKVEDDGAKYFGRFVDVKAMRAAVAILRKVFPLRTCSRLQKGLCLDYHIGLCPGVCGGRITKEEYRKTAVELCAFLSGKKKGFVRELARGMKDAAGKRRFEEAAVLRDKIEALSRTLTGTFATHEAELRQLQATFSLKRVPKMIEAFDISCLQGDEAVGSMVTFALGKPWKAGYRKFRIQEVRGMDDVGMMKEVLFRRYSRLAGEKQEKPGLVVIDGGKGHLSAAVDALGKTGLRDIDVIAIAKEFEHVYIPGVSKPVILPPGSRILKLLMRARDEAHRFAIGYHKQLRRRKQVRSWLDSISGIGKSRKAALMQHFGCVEEIRKATVDQLRAVPGISRSLAERLRGTV